MPLTSPRIAGLTAALSLVCVIGGCGDDAANNASATGSTPPAATNPGGGVPVTSTPGAGATTGSTPNVPQDLRGCREVDGINHLMARRGGCKEATALVGAYTWSKLGKSPETVDGFTCATLVKASRTKVIRCTKSGAEVRFSVARKSSLFLTA